MPDLPADYNELTWAERREVRHRYMKLQNGLCIYCNKPLKEKPHRDMPIDFELFPPGFMQHPVHLQHDHDTGMTEGAVHAYCNAVLWQYHGR